MRLVGLKGWCCSGVLAVGLLARPAAAETAITEEARQHFSAGVAHMQDPDGARYAEAYQEFLAAYKASPSWKILGNLGIAAMKLERDGEAVEAYSKYLQEGGEDIDPAEREQITRDMNTLKASLVTVTVDSAPAGAVIVDERIPQTGNAIVNRYGPLSGPLPLGIRAGKHRVTAQLEGYDSQVWEIELQPATTQSHSFALKKTPPPAGPGAAGGSSGAADRPNTGLRIASYTAFGVGVVGLAGGTIFALSAQSKADEAKDLCGGDVASCKLDEGSDDANKVVSLNDESGSNKTLAIVGFAVGGVGIAAGITLFILSNQSSKPEQAKLSPGPRVTPWVGYRSAGVIGQF